MKIYLLFQSVTLWSVTMCGLAGMLSFAASPADAQVVREKLFPNGEFFQWQGHAAFILRPDGAKSDRPLPWVFYAPTLAAYPDTHEEWMHRQFLAGGLAIAGVDVGEAYGSPDSRKIFDSFYDEVTNKRGLAPKPCLLGRSRGGLWVSSWACDHPERFSGLAGIYPVYDFRTYPGLEKTAKAYQLSTDELQNKIDQLNPIARTGALAKAKLPIFIIHGDEDKVVPLQANSAALEKQYQSAGSSSAIEVRVIKGQGHNFWEGFFRCQELVDFVIKQAGSTVK